MKTVVLMRARPSQADGNMLVGARGESGSEREPKFWVQVRDDVQSHKDLSDLQRDPNVAAAAPSMPMRLIGTADLGTPVAVTDRGSVTWGVKAVDPYNSVRTGRGVKVAVLDTGLDMDHPAFRNHGINFKTRNFVGGKPEDRKSVV